MTKTTHPSRSVFFTALCLLMGGVLLASCREISEKVTPFTDNTFDMLLFTMLVAFYRHRMDQYQNEKAAKMDMQMLTNEFLAAIRDHSFLKNVQRKVLEEKIETILKKWKDRISGTPEGLRFKTTQLNRTLLRTAQNKQNEDDLIAMQSMRNVEPVCRVQINQY